MAIVSSQKHILIQLFLGLLPQITKPTKVTTSTATLLDPIYSNTTLSAFLNGILINYEADYFKYFILRNIFNCKYQTKALFWENKILKFNQLLLQAYACSILVIFALVLQIIISLKKNELSMSKGFLVSLPKKYLLLKNET